MTRRRSPSCPSLAALVTTIALVGPARADEPATPEHVVLLDLGLHVIGAGYQRRVSDVVALSATTGLYDPWTTTDEVGDVRGGYLRLRPYVFVVGAAPRGLWLSPFVQGAIVRAKAAEGSASGVGFAVGAAAGWAFLFGHWFHLSLGAGAQYHLVDVTGEERASAFHGFHWHADITVGAAF